MGARERCGGLPTSQWLPSSSVTVRTVRQPTPPVRPIAWPSSQTRNSPSPAHSESPRPSDTSSGGACDRAGQVQYEVSTFAGLAGTAGSADGSRASATFDRPVDLSYSPDGTVALVADSGNRVIRQIDVATGEVTTVAGTAGVAGSADGTSATFNCPVGVCYYDAETALVVDNCNHLIRRVNAATGEVTTVAGVSGNQGSNDGVGAAASFDRPSAIACAPDGSSALILQPGAVREFVIATNEVTTIAGAAGIYGASDGTGTAARFGEQAYGVSYFQTGTSYRSTCNSGVCTSGWIIESIPLVADLENHVIRQMIFGSDADWHVTTVSGLAGTRGSDDGDGDTATFAEPRGIVCTKGARVGNFEVDRSIWVTTADHRIRKIERGFLGWVVTTVAGTGSAGRADGMGIAASFNTPAGMSVSPVDGKTILIADTENHLIRSIVGGLWCPLDHYWDATAAACAACSGTRYCVTTVAGLSDTQGSADGDRATATFDDPMDVAYSPDGTFALVADAGNNLIRQIDMVTGGVTTLAGTAGVEGSDDGVGTASTFYGPGRICISADGTTALVAYRYSFFTSHHLFGAGSDLLRKIVLATGEVITLGATFAQVGGLSCSPDGSTALVADSSRIHMLDLTTGEVSTIAGSESVGSVDGFGTAASFQYPASVSHSPDGTTALVADVGSGGEGGLIRKIVLATGEVTTLAGVVGAGAVAVDGVGTDASFVSPTAVSHSGDGTFALVADFAFIRKIDVATGQVTTLSSGLTGQDFSIDFSSGFPNGPGDVARFSYVPGISISPDGSAALVADSWIHSIRKITLSSCAGVDCGTGASCADTANGTSYICTASAPRACSSNECNSDETKSRNGTLVAVILTIVFIICTASLCAFRWHRSAVVVEEAVDQASRGSSRKNESSGDVESLLSDEHSTNSDPKTLPVLANDSSAETFKPASLSDLPAPQSPATDVRSAASDELLPPSFVQPPESAARDFNTRDEEIESLEDPAAIQQLTGALVACGTTPALAEGIANERTALQWELLKRKLKLERDLALLLAAKIAEAQAQFDAALAAIQEKEEVGEELMQQLMLEYEANRLTVIRTIELKRRESRAALEKKLRERTAEMVAKHQVEIAADNATAALSATEVLHAFDVELEGKQLERAAEAAAKTDAACVDAADAAVDARLPEPVRDAEGTVIRVLDQVILQGFTKGSKDAQLEGKQATVTQLNRTTVEVKLQGEKLPRVVSSKHLVLWKGNVAKTADTHNQAVPFRLSNVEKFERQERAIWKKLRKKLGNNRTLFGKKLETSQDLFSAIDQDKSGKINFLEFERALQRLGMGLSEQQTAEVLRAADVLVLDGMISFEEFMLKLQKQAVGADPEIEASTIPTDQDVTLDDEVWVPSAEFMRTSSAQMQRQLDL